MKKSIFFTINIAIVALFCVSCDDNPIVIPPAAVTYRISTRANPPYGGRVSWSCGPDLYKNDCDSGETLNVMAVPYDDYIFTGWTDSLTSSESSVTITMDGNKLLTANFQPTYTEPEEIEMVYVNGGTFTMGCTEEQGDDCYAGEARSVTVGSFFIGKYEVTQGLWKSVMGSLPEGVLSSGLGVGDGYPVYNISWSGVVDFITGLNEKAGKNYRLPTEAEWEYAARGGNMSNRYLYSGSDNIDDVAWYSENIDSETHPLIHSAGTKQANELGIYDMSGNVSEVTSDWYANNYLGGSDFRVIRGGSWYERAQSSRVFARTGVRMNSSNSVGSTIGFRLTLTP